MSHQPILGARAMSLARLAALVLVAACMLSGCHRDASADADESSGDSAAVVGVRTAVAAKRPFRETIDALGTVAARLWWMLDNLGHRRVALLDGGLRAWRDAGLPESTGVSSSAPKRLELADRWSNVVDRDELLGRLDEVTLLDARVAERYRGDVEPVDPKAGHIPSAVSAPAKTTLGADGRFLQPHELGERLRTIAPADRPVVTSCGSGVTACHTALALRVAGLPDPLLYPGSFSDWSRSELPVAVGSDPGILRADS